jgi:hypothetical protein
MRHQETTVTSRGNVSASFGVPGLITIPSGGRGAVHNVTIAQMTLLAHLSWVSVPKVDFGSVHLEVRAVPLSCFYDMNCNCTLLPGESQERIRVCTSSWDGECVRRWELHRPIRAPCRQPTRKFPLSSGVMSSASYNFTSH